MSGSLRVVVMLFAGVLLHPGLAPAQETHPDPYLCYRAGSVLGRKLPAISRTRVELQDRLGGPHQFAVRLLGALCNPASIDGSVVSHANVHLAGLTIHRSGGTPRLVPSTVTVSDPFATRALVLERVSSLLDVTRVRSGTEIPVDLNDDPTKADVEVNRFECYTAVPPRDAPPQIPSARLVGDEVFPSGQQFLIKRVRRVCLPTDADGATPGAATRDTLLVCYAVQLPQGEKFPREILATRSQTVGTRVVGRRRPTELCVTGRLLPGD